MPDGYLVSVGVKADFSDLKSDSKAGAWRSGGDSCKSAQEFYPAICPKLPTITLDSVTTLST